MKKISRKRGRGPKAISNTNFAEIREAQKARKKEKRKKKRERNQSLKIGN